MPHYKSTIKEFNLDLIHHPIKDHEVPRCIKEYHNLVISIYSKISDGRNVVIHCAGGQGRAGTVVSGVLCAAGMSPQDAIKAVQERRRSSIKRESQQRFVHTYAQIFCADILDG